MGPSWSIAVVQRPRWKIINFFTCSAETRWINEATEIWIEGMRHYNGSSMGLLGVGCIVLCAGGHKKLKDVWGNLNWATSPHNAKGLRCGGNIGNLVCWKVQRLGMMTAIIVNVTRSNTDSTNSVGKGITVCIPSNFVTWNVISERLSMLHLQRMHFKATWHGNI